MAGESAGGRQLKINGVVRRCLEAMLGNFSNSGGQPLAAAPGIYPVTLTVWSCNLSAPVSGDLLVTVLPAMERHKVYLPLMARQ